MAVNFMDEAPVVVRDYLLFLQVMRGKSIKTIDEYYIDLRTFFRFIKKRRKLVEDSTQTEDIKIDDIDLDLIKSITYTDIDLYINYLQRERSNSDTTRSRKISSLKSFFKYLCDRKNLIENNPAQNLEFPITRNKKLPKYLTLEQCIELLNAIDGKHQKRDYCIITLFLNCGLRLSELVSLNITDIRTDNTVKILGKGRKERIIYLNEACISAINDYLAVRPTDGVIDKNALFVSNQLKRMSPKTVQALVYKYLEKIGLDSQGYSCHKLRHTAATMMYQHGNVDIRVLKDFLGHTNISTTEIYTHLSNKQVEDAANSTPLSKIHNKK